MHKVVEIVSFRMSVVLRSCIWVRWLVLFFMTDLSKPGSLSLSSLPSAILQDKCLCPVCIYSQGAMRGASSGPNKMCFDARAPPCVYLNMMI